MSKVEETLRIQATRAFDNDGEEDFEDFDLQLVFYPKVWEHEGPKISFYAVNDELFYMPLSEFIKLFNRALCIWEGFQTSEKTEAKT